jgi:hypothetical protein
MADAKIVLSAQDKTSAAFASARRSLSGIGTAAASVQGALAGVGVAAAAFALSSMLRQARQTIDGFKDLSDATGSSIENISALDRIARATGGNFEQVSGILVKFNQVLAEAKPGSGPGAVLTALNLDIDELKRLDPAEALRLTAVAFEGFANGAEKGRAYQELFGRSVREAAPFLKDLAEAKKLDAAMTTEASDEVDRFNKQMALLGANAEDVWISLSVDGVAALNVLIDRFRVGQREGENFLVTLLKQTQIARILGFDKVATPYTDARIELDRINQSLESGKLNATQIRIFTEKRLALEKEIGGYLSSRAGGGRGFVNPDSVKPSLVVPGKEDKNDAAKRAREAAERARLEALRDMERTLERIAVLSEAEGRQYESSADAVMDANAALRDEISLLGLDDQARIALLQTKEREAIADKELLLIGLQSAGADATTIGNLEREIALRRQRIGLLEEQATGIKAEEKRKTDKDLAEQEKEAAKRRTETLASSIEDGILNGFRDGKSAADIFLDELKGQFAKAVLRPVIEPLAAAGSAVIGNFLKDILSFDGGGYTGPGSRSGGLDGRGGFMAMLHPDETVVDHTKGQGAGGPVINIFNTIGSVASQADVAAGMQVVESRIYGALSRSSRYGGAAS